MFCGLSTYVSTRQEPGVSLLPPSHCVTGLDLNDTHTGAVWRGQLCFAVLCAKHADRLERLAAAIPKSINNWRCGLSCPG